MIEFGKVEQQFRPCHGDHRIKQVPIPLNTDTVIQSTPVKALVEKTYWSSDPLTRPSSFSFRNVCRSIVRANGACILHG